MRRWSPPSSKSLGRIDSFSSNWIAWKICYKKSAVLGDAKQRWDENLQHVPTANRRSGTSQTTDLNSKNSARQPSRWAPRLRWCGLANSVVKHNLKANFSTNKLVVLTSPVAKNPQCTQPNNQDTGVVDSGASNIYFAKAAPLQNFNSTAPKVHVGTATDQVKKI